MKVCLRGVTATALAGAMVFGSAGAGIAAPAQAETVDEDTAVTATTAATTANTDLADGTYDIGVRLNDTLGMIGTRSDDNNKYKLTVENGIATVRFRMKSTGIDAAYVGTSSEASQAGDSAVIKPEIVTSEPDAYGIQDESYYFSFPLRINQGKSENVTVSFRSARNYKRYLSGTKGYENPIRAWYQKTVTFAVPYQAAKPGKVSGVKAKSTKKKQVKVSWKKLAENATGYQVRYSVKKGMGGAKTITVNGKSKASTTVKKLKSGKKYFFQVRGVNDNSFTTTRGAWSASKTVKAK